MPRLTWGDPGARVYETGVDRGVLYAPGSDGVAWNGLISVDESPTGGEPRPFYLDGVKYLNLSSAEEFAASLNAFNAPLEFAPCDGRAALQNGLFATQQPRKPFDLSYRTTLGNDLTAKHGYKIHLVYNALAAPSERSNQTTTESPTATEFSWSISTTPPPMTGVKPTAHLVFDTRFVAPLLLQAMESMLYGDESIPAQMPSAQQVIDMFTDAYLPLKLVSLSANVWEIHEVDSQDSRAIKSSTAPADPAVGEEPILWLDTSAGNYAIPKLVTGA